VTRFLTTIADWFWDGVDVRWVTTNGQTSAVLRRDGATFAVLTVNASTEGIDQVLWMMNPVKISGLS
jgi:RNA polymerase sigma-70 factor (ECF subfamily)